MWIIFSGFPLPFVLLSLCLLGSFVCAQIIASDDNTPSVLCNLESDVPECAVKKTSQSLRAFINPQKTSHIIDAIFSSNKKEINPNNNMNGISMSTLKEPSISNHYTCPPTSLEALRRRYGTSDFWGDWSPAETRRFYKQMLPKALSIDGALGLSLKQRAEIASANRHALRLYARERCHLPARIIAKLYDGLRHLHSFGTWNSDGMSWTEVKQKYSLEAKAQGCETEEDVLLFVYNRIVEKASATNPLFDEISASNQIMKADSNQMAFLLMKSIFEAPKIYHRKSSKNSILSAINPQPPQFSFKLGNFNTKYINAVIPKLFSV